MPKARSSKRQLDSGTEYSSRTGRPIRKCRQAVQGPPLEDDDDEESSLVLSEALVEEHTQDDSCTINVADHQNRKRPPSPPSTGKRSGRAIDSGIEKLSTSPGSTTSTGSPTQITIKDVIVNVPPGHQGPIILQIDMSSQRLDQVSQQPQPNGTPTNVKAEDAGKPLPATRSRLSKRWLTQPHLTNVASSGKSDDDSSVSFLDLPAEIRNEIYRQVLVAPTPLRLSSPALFNRGSALLRTCKQTYDEGRTLLYSENHFHFSRRFDRTGSYWESEWNEAGFKPHRKFLKIITPSNIGLIRHVTLSLEDAVPCLNPDKATADARRFVNDDVLVAVLKRLRDHAKLKRLELLFRGRRRVEQMDTRFLKYLTAIQADEVIFSQHLPDTPYVSESKQEVAVKKMCLEKMVREEKLYD